MRRSLLAVLLVAGCGRGLCARHSDCPAQHVCTPAGVCELATDDGGVDATGDAIPSPDAAVDAAPDAAPDAPTDGG